MPTSALIVAAPFIASAVLLVVGPFIGIKIEARLRDVYEKWLKGDLENAFTGTKLMSYDPAAKAKSKLLSHDPAAVAKGNLVSWDPATVAKSAIWAMDAAQILAAFLLPVLGVIVLRPSTGAVILYAVYCGSVLIALFVFIRRYRIDDYHTRWRVRAFTLVPLIGIPVNVVAAAVAYIIAS
jgi:hypothetical protein